MAYFRWMARTDDNRALQVFILFLNFKFHEAKKNLKLFTKQDKDEN